MGVTTHPDGTEYQVEVVSQQMTPDFITELRARATAIRDSGVLGALTPDVEEMPLGNIERLTEVDGVVEESRGGNKKAQLYQVVVKE